MARNDKARQQIKAVTARQTITKAAQNARAARQDLGESSQAGASQPSAQEYAGDKVQAFAQDRAADAAGAATDTFRLADAKRKAYRDKAVSAKEHRRTAPHSSAALPSDTRRDAFRRGRYRPKATGQNPASAPSQPPLAPTRLQAQKKRIIQEKAVRRYLEKTAGTWAARRTALPSVPTRAMPAAKGRPGTLLKRALDRLGLVLRRAAKAAVQSLLMLLGAGGIVLLLAVVVGAAAAIIGSPMGILFADESGDPSAIPIAAIVQETNAEFAKAINELAAANPQCSEVDIQYDYASGGSWAGTWPEVLALFAVHTNLQSDSDVVVIDEAKAQQIKDTFWTMHQIIAEVETLVVEQAPEEAPEEEAEDTTPEAGSEEETGTEEETASQPQYRYVLHITVRGKNAEQMAEEYGFTADQKEILRQLLSAEMRPSLLALCGGAFPGNTGDETMLWPLPGYDNITTHFGESDAFGRPGHRGIDIAAPEGTPILAAHSGTVMVSGWSDSYGNQVVLDNGAGLATRYAHMTQAAVTAGETVTAGQVIGYVGSTGDATGFHLHFEVQRNGALTDPLAFVEQANYH